MRSLVACVALVSAVVGVTSAAWAKGPSVAFVCGASGCETYRGEREILPIHAWWGEPFFQRSTPRPAAYYRIKLLDPTDRTSILLYSPARRAIRIWQGASSIPGQTEPIGPYWRSVPPAAARALRPFLRGVTPFPASRGWRH